MSIIPDDAELLTPTPNPVVSKGVVPAPVGVNTPAPVIRGKDVDWSKEPSTSISNFATLDADRPSDINATMQRENTFYSTFKKYENMPVDVDVVDPNFDASAYAEEMEIP